MGPYLSGRGHQLTATHLYREEELPPLDQLEWLIVMGGPMGVDDEGQFPWLSREETFVRQAIDAGKTVLGVCLGAQLIAHALGAKVSKNAHREIGWFPIRPSAEAAGTILGDVFPDSLDVFHWHGDTFEIPAGASLLASSEACRNQGFVVEDRVVALQFHLETTPDTAKALVDNCRHELDGSRYIQTEEEILSRKSQLDRINQVMHALLQRLEANGA